MSSCQVLSIACTILSPLYVSVFMCMSTMCINMCAQAWRLRSTLGVVLQKLSWVVAVLFCFLFFVFVETGSLVGIWYLSIMLSYLANKLQGSASLCLPRAGITSACNHARLLTQVLGIKIMSSCLHGKYFADWAFLFFYIFLDLFYFTCMSILPSCMYMYHMHAWCPRCQMRALNFLELELQI